jgi:hypothetical protein
MADRRRVASIPDPATTDLLVPIADPIHPAADGGFSRVLLFARSSAAGCGIVEAARRKVDDGLREAFATGRRALGRAISLLHVEHRAAAVHEADSTD